MTTETAYPLSWPLGWPRTNFSRVRARFERRDYVVRQGLNGNTYREKRHLQLTVADGLDRLGRELDLLPARNAVLSSNLVLRLDGLPRSGQPEPQDPGVAVYFTFRKQRTALACDRWDRAADNFAAVAAHIDALRAIERYGVGTLEQAFRGYQRLEDFTNGIPWRRVMGFKDGDSVNAEILNARYRELAQQYHPDKGGSLEQMAQLNVAIKSARTEFPS